jgi:hypothetical protein
VNGCSIPSYEPWRHIECPLLLGPDGGVVMMTMLMFALFAGSLIFPGIIIVVLTSAINAY